jgi:phage tail sheath protein FI
MSTYVSPGVYTVELDLSAYVSDLSTTIVGMVGTASSGPTNSPTLITTQAEFVSTFGKVDPSDYMGYAAMAYLEQGTMLWVTRVASSTASYASEAMFLPQGYTQYTGTWTLAGQTSSTLTFNLADLPTVSGPGCTIVLPADTSIPYFDPTDTTNTAHANGKLGSDFSTLATLGANSPVLGVPFTILTGAGKNTTPTITGVGVSGSIPQVSLSLSAFASSNSPATALPSGTIALAVPTTWIAPSTGTGLITVGLTSTSVPINLVYTSASGTTLLEHVQAGTFSNSDLESLLSVTPSTGTVTSYNIEVPIFDPTVSGNNANTLAILNATLTALLALVNSTTAPTSGSPNSLLFYNNCRTLLPSSTVYGIGSITSGGNSEGFSAVTTNLDANGNILQLRLASLVAGFSGVFKYSTQTLAVSSHIVSTDQILTGTFAVGYYRPSWSMVTSGSSYVPTVIKFTSLGETDDSDTSITLSMVAGDITSTSEQNYTVNIYSRTASSSISTSSVRLSDFTLKESYYGTIENIQSQMASSSRIALLKIDYTTVDILNITTGTLTNNGDNLTWTPGFLLSETSSGITSGTNYISTTSGYNKSLTGFLLGGSVGSAITSYDIIGDGVSTGLYSFNNAGTIDINILVAPGWSADPGVSAAMVTICAARGDSIAIIDTPFGLTVQEVISYRNNIANINSSYAAMYYPWIKIADSVNSKNVYVPPSGMVAGQYAYNDNVADVYYAPAGINRGMLTDALSTERKFSQGDRDALALAGINPIVNEPSYGIYIKGQATLQTASTALDRVNVRRMLLNLRKVIATASVTFEFQPGNSTTAYQLKQVADTLLSAKLKAGAIQSYTIDVGPDVNTALVLSNNQLAMVISIVPTLAAEIIVETFQVMPQTGLTSSTTTTVSSTS